MFLQKIIGRSFLVLCMIFVVIFSSMTYIARERTTMIIDDLSIDRVMAAKQGFINYLDNLSYQAMLRGAVLAKQERLITAIKEYNDNGAVLTDENYGTIRGLLDEFLFGYDFISVTDSDGIALARVDNGERIYPLPPNGYSLMANEDVRQVFETGEPVSSISFMLDNTTLITTTLYPVFDGDTILGVITCLNDLTNPKYINAYKDQSGSEVAIFLGQEEFISTFAYTPNPVRIVAGNTVIEAIFENGQEAHISFKEIGGVWYGTVFSPLTYRGEIIGMMFTGVDVSAAMGIRSGMDTLLMLIASIGFIVAIIFIIAVRRYEMMIKRHMEVQTIITRISQNFLTTDDIDTLITNAFRELGPVMKVSQILLFRARPAGSRTIVCTNEWIAPGLNPEKRISAGDIVDVSDSLFKAYTSLRGNDKFYISSDDHNIKAVLEPYRVNFTNFLSTSIFLDETIFAVVDFSRAKKRGRWSKDDINTASLVTNLLTGVFHRMMTEEKLVSAKEIAERNNRFKSAFLANVSHEIRTPMNAILGITEIYLQDQSSRANIEEGLSMIYDSGNLLLGIVNDILDLSKIEAGKMELYPEKYNIPSLLNDAIQICRLRYGSKPITFTLDIDKETPLNMIGDELRIRQILNNILSNAFKYTETGEVKVSVSAKDFVENDMAHASARPAPDDGEYDVTLIIRVEDTGQGMTAEQLEQIFDEFTRFNLEINRTTVGTGLGMSITKRLLELMNGEIDVKSQPGVGSVFTVRLPQKRVGRDICGSEMSEKLNSFRFHSISLKKKTQVVCEYMPYGSVLIVDDVESNLYVAKGMMIPYGLQIDTATSGFEAIDYIAGGKTYDVIFMDHMMPRMDGVETVRNIREMGYTGSIIALTANALTGQAEMFMENGCNGFLPKPVDTRELNAVLIEHIRDKKPQEVVNAAREEAREAELLKALSAGADNSAEEKAQQERLEMLGFFISDTRSSVKTLEAEMSRMEETGEMNIDSYRISVHGMKSALRNIGEKDLSDFAYRLEQAALSRDYNEIAEKTPEFIYALKNTAEKYEGIINGI